MLSAAGPTTWATKSATRQRSLELLSWWRDELRAMYRGETSHPVMIALQETVEGYGIPIEPFERLISAFEQDQDVSEYQTFRAVARLLRTVGQSGRAACSLRGREPSRRRTCGWPTRSARRLQLANFWQDVARDLAIGRIYLPREDRDRFGCSEAELRAGVFTPAIRRS